MPLTPEQVQIIRSTVPVLETYGNAITTSFYNTLLAEIPALKNVFNKASQDNGHQAAALAGALYAYASNIDDLGKLSPAVEKICQKHASLHIQPEQYTIVGQYLLRAMGDVLGSALTPEILGAWEAAYWQLANIMMKREEQLYEDKNGWTGWRDFVIAEKTKESEEITSFYLKPVDGQKPPNFLPGQYISVKTDVPSLDIEQSRQYSLSDAPTKDHYRISVKKETGTDTNDPDAAAIPGCISNLMHEEKQVGDILQVSHPAGEFYLDHKEYSDSPVVLMSAGVGMTPMLSMLNTLAADDSNRRISFIHGARSRKARAFARHVQNVAAQKSNITYTSFISTPNQDCDLAGRHYYRTGRIDIDQLDDELHLCLDEDKTQYFICGPLGFMKDMERNLMAKGVEKERIKMEIFGTGAI